MHSQNRNKTHIKTQITFTFLDTLVIRLSSVLFSLKTLTYRKDRFLMEFYIYKSVS